MSNPVPNFGVPTYSDSEGVEEDSESVEEEEEEEGTEEEGMEEEEEEEGPSEDSLEDAGVINIGLLKAHRRCLNQIHQALDKYTTHISKF